MFQDFRGFGPVMSRNLLFLKWTKMALFTFFREESSDMHSQASNDRGCGCGMIGYGSDNTYSYVFRGRGRHVMRPKRLPPPPRMSNDMPGNKKTPSNGKIGTIMKRIGLLVNIEFDGFRMLGKCQMVRAKINANKWAHPGAD